jgi:imidazolonepropionase
MAELPTDWDASNRIPLDRPLDHAGPDRLPHPSGLCRDRAHEFELRLAGASYEDIARAGGGIVSTVKATRAASEDDLVRASLPRLDRLLAEGVTTIEIKSGYGLERETEMRMLRAARRLARGRDVGVVTSFLGAHALPPEANGDKERYIDEVCADDSGDRSRPARRCRRCVLRNHRVHARADRARVRGRAGAGLPVKLHADQLSNLHGASSPPNSALSAIISNTRRWMASPQWRSAGTVADLLPGAFYVLREKQYRRSASPAPPGAYRWRLATDSNPGTSPITRSSDAQHGGDAFRSDRRRRPSPA